MLRHRWNFFGGPATIGRRYFAEAAGGTAGSGGAAGATGGAGAGQGSAAGAAGAGSAGPVPLAGPDGVLAANWLQHEKVNPAYRTSKSLAVLKSIPEMADKIVNLEGVLGKKRAVIPESDQDKDAVDAYYRNVGWPEGPDKYSPAKLPEGVRLDAATDKTMRGWAHELHLTQAQYAGLVERLAAGSVTEKANEAAELAQARTAADAAEKTAWGTKWAYNDQLVGSVAGAFATPADLAALQADGVLQHPVVRRLLVAVGTAVSPDRLHVNSQGVADGLALERQIEELQTSEAYRKPEHARHKAVTDQVLELRQQLINVKSGK